MYLLHMYLVRNYYAKIGHLLKVYHDMITRLFKYLVPTEHK